MLLARERNKFSQAYVAYKIGVDRSSVSKWENGENSPRAELLPKIAALYNCTIDDLYGEVEEEDALEE